MRIDAIRTATWALHKQAEKSGIVADIIAGRASPLGVALLLRNLLPVYQVLDKSAFGHPLLARAGAIEADLHVLAPGANLPLLPEGTAYAERVRTAGEGVVAHAYVRYLGDLNGGSILRRRFEVCLGEIASRLTFLSYPGIEDRVAFIREYRARLDFAVRAEAFELIVQEALVAFGINIALSEAVRAWVES